jgi:predicted metal-dependent peptidase
MEFKKIHTDIIDSFAKFHVTLESNRNATKGIKVIGKFDQYVVEKNNYELFEADVDKENQARVKVNRNLLWINSKKGFFAQLLAKLNIYGSSDPKYTTMCTNGLNIQYHPDFVLSQSDAAIRFVLCHEILHCVGDHMTRRGNRNPLLWNYAADYAINPILNEEVVPGQFEWPKQPDGSRMGLFEEKYVGMRAEDIYELLKEDEEQQKKATEDSGESPESGTHVIDSDEDLSEPDSENSVVQDVRDEQAEEESEMGEGGDKPSEKPGDKPGEGKGKPGDKPGDGESDKESGQPDIVGKRVRITTGPNTGKIGTVKSVLPNGDIIVE